MNPLLTPLETATPVAATGVTAWAWLLIAVPLVSAGVLLIIGRAGDRWGHFLGTLASLVSAGLAVTIFVTMLGLPTEGRSQSVHLYDWISGGNWTIPLGLQVDQLSVLFCLLITIVGSLIHIYSIGYMAHDPRRRRFFAFLNLFIAAMLLLVLADNYLVLFFGWEGVGLASYLLIGFWQERPSAAAAAKKAFVINRVGDMGMAIAISLMLATFGTVTFSGVNAAAAEASPATITLLGLLLLWGACAKSAQVPLQAWLLDAMEGPTPVSALIHAATMVTAGVYLVTRSHEIYAHTEWASTAVVVIGTITLLAGAWIGCSKDDIKKVLAGSTMSQIGYMMLAAGIGPAGYAFAIFHLVTHGFFKANMFLGAGSVMHAMDDDVDMRHYGGLAKYMPITFATFGAGFLAIIGFPFTAGFFSKDHIIEAAFEHNQVIGILALVGAAVTAFYMTRLMLMTFGGKKRWRDDVHPHESPLVMTIPLILLGIASLGGGLLLNNWIGGWLQPAVGGGNVEAHAPSLIAGFASPIGWITLAVVAIGVIIAFVFFGPRKDIPEVAPATRNPLTVAGRHDLFGDAFNDAVVVRPGEALTRGVLAVDRGGIDGAIHGFVGLLGGLSVVVRRLQTGYVRSYALVMVVGAAVLGGVLVLTQLS